MKRSTLMLVTALALLGLAGCAQDESDGSGNPAPVPAPGPYPGGTPPPETRPPDTNPPPPGGKFNWDEGSTVDFFVNSVAAMEAYVGRPVNFPNADEGIVLKMNLFMEFDSDNQAFGGRIHIAYDEPDAQGNLVYHDAEFTTGGRAEDIQFNRFVTVSGVNHFKAFTMDDMGGIIVVINQISGTNMGGKIYFHNFAPSTAPKPWLFGGAMCWNIKLGPYDCRDWLVGGGEDKDKTIDITSAIFPNRMKDGAKYYTELGSFSNLNSNNAFH